MNPTRSNGRAALAAILLIAALATPAATLLAQCPSYPSSCPTPDDLELQAKIDAAVAAGGGVIQLEPRTYNTCRPIILPSNTHLRGAGRGATTIRGTQIVDGGAVSNSFVVSTIAAVAATNVTISDLTVDHVSCPRHANGISILPGGTSAASNEAYDGDVSSNVLVQRVEVLGYPGVHSYMIWNMRGQHVKILNNWVDGNSSSSAAQEGIESYGGNDVLISGNTVKNIGAACLNVGSAGGFDSGTYGVTMADNHLSNCGIGVNLGTALSSSNTPQNQVATRVTGNVISGARTVAIAVSVFPGTEESDLLISGNTIRSVSGNAAAGISFRSTGATLASSATVSNTVTANHFENIRGANAHAIRIWGYPNVRVSGNTITGVDSAAVYVVDSDDVEVSGNRINDGRVAPIQFWKVNSGSNRLVIDRNRIDWAGQSAGILLVGSSFGAVRDNMLTRKDAATPTPIVTAETCGIVAMGNGAWYLQGWSGPLTPLCEEKGS